MSTDRARSPWDPETTLPAPRLSDFRREPRDPLPPLDPLPTTYRISEEEWRRLYANMAAAYHHRIPLIEADVDETRAAALLSAAESARTRQLVQSLGDHLVMKAIEAATKIANAKADDVEKKVIETGSHNIVTVLDQRELAAQRKFRERAWDLFKVAVGGALAVGIEQLVKYLAAGHF